MARCTAPVRGHKTAIAAAACPECGDRLRGFVSRIIYNSPHPSNRKYSRSGVVNGNGGSMSELDMYEESDGQAALNI